MSLHHIAQHIQSKGRGPDTELVHMTKGEVAGLQALAQAHGGTLTRNPHTGLPEASFLSSILPAAIGAGAVALVGPAALPWVAGGLGGLSYLQSGNLMKGISTGLGAYGGGELAGGLAGLGTSEAGANLAQANEAAATKLGEEANARDILMARDASAANAMAANPIQTGLTTAASDPSKLAAQMGGVGSLAKAGLMAAGPAISEAMTPNRAIPIQSGDANMGPRYRYDPGTANPFPTASASGAENKFFPGQGYTRISNDEAKALYGYADGGMTYGQGDDQGDPNLMQVKAFDPVVRMASGGISTLGGYSDGGRLLKGPGDGVSDSIPASIGDKQPARLADGEFVVPARIVSELGNGSTDAGARQLYSMMDRIQKARSKTTGKGRFSVDAKASKMLPA
jgi:hypothetical protein